MPGGASLQVAPGALTVNRYNNADDLWSSTGKLTISYCVSTSFGSRYQDVVTGVAEAAVGWEAASNVMFTYRSDQDGSCTSSNGNVTFSVEPVSGTNYNAASFFPSWGRSSRRLLIDTGNIWNDGCKSFTGIMKHELGHALGFRHEHIWVGCTSEGTSDARQVTSYDVASVMHYANCGTKGCVDYSLSPYDKSGAASPYGFPNRFHLERWITKAGGYQSTNQWVAGDFNGDGKDDLGHGFSDNGNIDIDAHLSSGSSFALNRWTTEQGAFPSAGKWAVGDFDGNGKDDIGKTWQDGSYISIDAHVSTGSAFAIQRWDTLDGGWQSAGSWVAGDFDNDGYEEMALAFSDGGNYSIDVHTF